MASVKKEKEFKVGDTVILTTADEDEEDEIASLSMYVSTAYDVDTSNIDRWKDEYGIINTVAGEQINVNSKEFPTASSSATSFIQKAYAMLSTDGRVKPMLATAAKKV